MAQSEAEFIARYGAVYEHSSWVAEQAAPIAAGVDDIARVAEIMADCVDNSSKEAQLALIRAHPDLAGKAQIAGKLTDDSSSEQTSAGLDQCSAEEYERFGTLNRSYREKFGFPFVMAVRDSTRSEILHAFEARLQNDAETEFESALAEIHKIARLRLDALDAD